MRRAVEKTVQSTLGTAEASRDRAQQLADDVLRRAEKGFQDLRGIGTAGEDVNALRAEVRTLRKRIEKLEGTSKGGKKKSAKSSS